MSPSVTLTSQSRLSRYEVVDCDVRDPEDGDSAHATPRDGSHSQRNSTTTPVPYGGRESRQPYKQSLRHQAAPHTPKDRVGHGYVTENAQCSPMHLLLHLIFCFLKL